MSVKNVAKLEEYFRLHFLGVHPYKVHSFKFHVGPHNMYANICESVCMGIDNPLFIHLMSGLCSQQPLMEHIIQTHTLTHSCPHTEHIKAQPRSVI